MTGAPAPLLIPLLVLVTLLVTALSRAATTRRRVARHAAARADDERHAAAPSPAREFPPEQAAELEHQEEAAQLLAGALEQTNGELKLAAARADAALREAESAATRMTRLHAVTAELSATLTPAEVARVVVEHMIAAVGARAGSLGVVDEEAGELTLLGAVGYPPETVARFARVPLDAAFPLADAARIGAPVILATAEERSARYPDLEALRRSNGDGAMAAIPLVARGRRVGALGINFPEEVALGEEDRRLLLAIAQQCALALDRALLYEAERRARREAEEANAAKTQFLATMSHELRTPLNAQIGYAQLLELEIGGPLTERQRDYVARLATSSQHLLALIDDVLDLSRLDAGRMAVVREGSATRTVLAAALDLTHPQAAARGIRLVEAPSAGPEVRYVGDEDRVRQILLNLLSNAVKFTEPGGTVTVACGLAAEAPPAAHLHGDGPWAFIRVADTGIGIPAEEQSRVFDEFHQVERGHTRRAGGTGLGLAISRRLARLMGGDLTLESTPGEGSTLTLWLPTEGTGASAA